MVVPLQIPNSNTEGILNYIYQRQWCPESRPDLNENREHLQHIFNNARIPSMSLTEGYLQFRVNGPRYCYIPIAILLHEFNKVHYTSLCNLPQETYFRKFGGMSSNPLYGSARIITDAEAELLVRRYGCLIIYKLA